MEKKINMLDKELLKYKEQMKKMRDGPSKVGGLRKILIIVWKIQNNTYFHRKRIRKTEVKANVITMKMKYMYKNNQKILKPNPNVRLLHLFVNFKLVFQNITRV